MTVMLIDGLTVKQFFKKQMNVQNVAKLLGPNAKDWKQNKM